MSKHRLKIPRAVEQSKKNTLCLWRDTEDGWKGRNELNDDLPLRTFQARNEIRHDLIREGVNTAHAREDRVGGNALL